MRNPAAARLTAARSEPRTGIRLTDVAARTHLSPSTTQRVLAALIEAGLAEQDGSSARFFSGLALLGWSSARGSAAMRSMAASAHLDEATLWLSAPVVRRLRTR